MGEPPAGVDWKRVYREAMVVAAERLSPGRAQEVVSAGIEAVFTGEVPWDPAGKASLAAHAVAVGYNRMRNEWRKAKRQQREDLVAKVAEVDVARAPPRPDDALEDKEHRAHLFTRLVAACEGDQEALAVIEAERLGIRGLDAQMEHLKMSERDLKNARLRIGRRMEPIDPEDREGKAS